MGILREPAAISVYREMWEAFAAWSRNQSPALTLSSLTLSDLQAFQAARFGRKAADSSLSPRYTLRLMRLIDRVLRHHAAHNADTPNTSASDWIAKHPEVRFAEAAAADPSPEFLTNREASLLITYVSAARPRPAARFMHAPGPMLAWQDVRNRASVALQLGAGLTPADVRALTTSSIAFRGSRDRMPDLPLKIRVPSDGDTPARDTPIARWAAQLLRHWIAVRALGIQGTYLFPATRGGKPWSRDSQYRCARQVLEDAGINGAEGGSFRLRHTFALRHLRHHAKPQLVARWLGVEAQELKRYAQVMSSRGDRDHAG
ncbi:tyrosine-type recombinase/integrase [Variovorax sp. OV329]|uniref:tyrosine-type recombinase/integrase n=1 Tax=Variovorax sp. OV329 TaxID=1882825 RepID=UPI0008F37237|nr:tyrosine-type recombinase/integrase [Variovorax sp. OV329]SFM91721.1 Site-specific recombinase XerD [Variovorax sp. OV329]